MIFLKKTTIVVSIPKIMNIYSDVWKIKAKTLKVAILAKSGQNLIIVGHSRGQKFFEQKLFWWSSKSYEDLTSYKKTGKY